MLALTRCVGQTITIGDNITVRILSVKDDRVEIDIVAPKNISVHREEVYRELNREITNS